MTSESNETVDLSNTTQTQQEANKPISKKSIKLVFSDTKIRQDTKPCKSKRQKVKLNSESESDYNFDTESESEGEYESENNSSDDVEEANSSEDAREEEETRMFEKRANRITRYTKTKEQIIDTTKEYCYFIHYTTDSVTTGLTSKSKMFIYDKPMSIRKIESLLKDLSKGFVINITKIEILEQTVTK